MSSVVLAAKLGWVGGVVLLRVSLVVRRFLAALHKKLISGFIAPNISSMPGMSPISCCAALEPKTNTSCWSIGGASNITSSASVNRRSIKNGGGCSIIFMRRFLQWSTTKTCCRVQPNKTLQRTAGKIPRFSHSLVAAELGRWASRVEWPLSLW